MRIENGSGEAVRELMKGFSDKRWISAGEESIVFQSEDGYSNIVYSDLGSGETYSSVEMEMWRKKGTNDTELMFKMNQEMDDGKIGYVISVPPYIDEYWDQSTGRSGVVYEADGRMRPIRRVKGLPRRIDMDKTVDLFLKQVAKGDFSAPVLVKFSK